jgi:serine/threonine-protein phosphatase 2A activator
VCLVTSQSLPSFLAALLGPELVAAGAAVELSAYLDESFGNQQRIDYGTGHELNFVLFLCCVNKMGLFSPSDHPALVFDVFTRYLDLMEVIQLTYWLEPAGSKGSWGLDDYQFLCFLWGSSQLIGHPDYPPSIVLNTDAIATLTSSYLYFQAVHFISRMKTGPFNEHSALLHSISQLQSWGKVNAGLIKMYEEEVSHPPSPPCVPTTLRLLTVRWLRV